MQTEAQVIGDLKKKIKKLQEQLIIARYNLAMMQTVKELNEKKS